jgi:SagB-type dehydrogenase family enzyme
MTMNKTAGQQFMLQTRYENLQPTGQMLEKPQPPLELAYDRNAPVIDLPLPETFPEININLLEFIELRTSVRNYSGKPVSLPELSYLLWCTQGVKTVIPAKATFRTVPSAGARHAFETYLLVNQVEGLEPGLYRFLAMEHKLQAVSFEEGMAAAVTEACLRQRQVANSAVTFIWTAAAERMTWKYGDRGYRYLHLDAGHVCQNLYLAAESVGCGVCAIAAFNDELLNTVLDLDGDRHFAVYVAAVGKK